MKGLLERFPLFEVFSDHSEHVFLLRFAFYTPFPYDLFDKICRSLMPVNFIQWKLRTDLVIFLRQERKYRLPDSARSALLRHRLEICFEVTILKAECTLFERDMMWQSRKNASSWALGQEIEISKSTIYAVGAATLRSSLIEKKIEFAFLHTQLDQSERRRGSA